MRGSDNISMLLFAQLVQHRSHEAIRILGIRLHVAHDHLHRHVSRCVVPAVVVGAHADHLVGDLGFSRELGLGQDRHVDDRASPAAVHVALGTRRKLWSLHADDGAAVVQPHAVALQRVSTAAHNVGDLRVEGVREAHVSHHAALEEGEGADALGAVNDLVGHHKVAGLDVFLQTSHGGEGNDGAHAEVAQGGYVGAGGDLVRCEFVVQAMAREKGDGDGVAGGGRRVVQDRNGRRRRAPGRGGLEGRYVSEARQRLQTSAADDCNGNVAVVVIGHHICSSSFSLTRTNLRYLVVIGSRYVVQKFHFKDDERIHLPARHPCSQREPCSGPYLIARAIKVNSSMPWLHHNISIPPLHLHLPIFSPSPGRSRMSKADLIAECVLKTFEALPTKFKPRTLPAGQREWVPLAGIVLSRGELSAATVTCAALATGMKCLPQSKLHLAQGNILHDWHAEILALRSFNRFLVDECVDLAKRGRGEHGQWVRWDQWRADEPPFALHDDVKIHMYCSEAPCGDASMELTMSEQTDATPWKKQQYVGVDGLLGRGNFDQLGVVRRKPSRPDAPQCLSKSCSDKLALKQCTGLLSAVLALLIHPRNVYLSTLVLPEKQVFCTAMERSFGRTGRMKLLAENEIQESWQRYGYSFTPFEVQTTTATFAFSKPPKNDLAVSSNLSAVYTPQNQEVLINGVLQGRKLLDARGASCVSRRRMWQAVRDVIASAEVAHATKASEAQTYAELKQSPLLKGREIVKRDVRTLSLKGWKSNQGDESWVITTKSEERAEPSVH